MNPTALLLAVSMVSTCASAAALPHLVVILGDDVGYYNMGFTEGNPEATTPYLDALAKEGMQLRRHYVYKYCSPTRSSLMSGRYPMHVNQNNPSFNGGGVDIRMTMLPAKLKKAGYATHHVGKWHLGATAMVNVPVERGFDTSLGYLSGSEDHWTQRISEGVDLWEGHSPAYGKNGTYGAYIYTQEAERIIREHDPAVPFFMYAAFQNTHFPNEVPSSYLDPNVPDKRRVYHGMARCLDEAVGNVTKALKARGMWDNTLLVFSADNGGATAIEGCASNNYPLRGSKHTDFEGGVRVGAFVAGGVLPDKMRGTKQEGYIHVADWYATLCGLAGVDPEDHVDGLPDIDSLNMWPLLSGENSTSPRTEIPLAVKHSDSNFPEGEGLIVGEWKVVLNNLNAGIHMGPQYPNESTVCKFSDPGCPTGCLFNIIDDPSEYHDLSAQSPAKLNELLSRLAELRKTVYQTGWPGNHTTCSPIADVVQQHRGFVAPRCK